MAQRLDRTIYLSDEELARWKHTTAQSAGASKMRETIVTFARLRGGLTLEFWQRKVGPWFDQPHLMKLDRIAEELGVPVSKLNEIYAETWEHARKRLDKDPDFQALTRGCRQRDSPGTGGSAKPLMETVGSIACDRALLMRILR